MAGTMKAAPFCHLFLTLIILAETQWSLCGSTETQAARHRVSLRSREVLFRHTLELSHVSTEKREAGTGFRGAVGARSHSAASFGERRGRLLDSHREIDAITPNKDVEALMAFKAEITSDPLGLLDSWRANDTDPCSWLGVQCSQNSRQVTTLQLVGGQLEGTVSSSLGQLPSLEELDLSENSLTGSVPSNLANCSKLLDLNISFNSMTGDVPTSFGRLQQLQSLDLSNNTLSGEIPGTLGNCSSLLYLDLGFNSFRGGIPSQFGTLQNLTSLILHETSISGSIPPSLGNCSSLTVLFLGGNSELGGEVPPQLGSLITLQFFSLSMCGFAGSIPLWICNITALQSLNLNSNHFTGQIPEGLSQLLNLTYLELGGNFFSGEIPSSLGLLSRLLVLFLANNALEGEIPRSIVNMTSLTDLLLYENQLSGTIPEDINLLRNFESLKLFDNDLSGVIPESLCNCSGLKQLQVGGNPFDPQVIPPCTVLFENLTNIYLSEMNLEGEIPKEIGKLSNLVEFLVFTNKLTGEIPKSFQNCTVLYEIDVRDNQLTGEIPPDLGQLPLQYLYFGSNFLAPGPFPSFIYNLTMLRELELQFDEFSGKLDGDFNRLPNLVVFAVGGNNFEGPIPESLGNCSMLSQLEMAGMSLSGQIPAALSNLSRLSYFSIGGNNFHGSIPGDFMRNFQILEYFNVNDSGVGGSLPADLGASMNLQHFIISGNDIEGSLPSSFANCTQLLTMDISGNRLSGSLPGNVFGAMSSLTMANLSHNSFSGSWPLQLNKLIQLQVIDVSANNISGAFLVGGGDFLSLEALDLSFNDFTGAIPQELGLLKKLVSFNASYNNFVGPIPDAGPFKNNITAASFLGNPGLCGATLGPQRLCSVPAGRSHCKGFKCSHTWIPVVAVLGTLTTFILLLSFAIIMYHRSKVNADNNLLMSTANPDMAFKEGEILAVINDPGHDNVIGVGARSTVYKAMTKRGQTVAIKVLKVFENPVGGQDKDDKNRLEREFGREARTLGKLRHRNVLKIFGLCFTLDVKAIILEYMPNGSLHTHLHREGPCELTWAQRFKILLGVTHGMVYLHHGFSEPIIHRDLKPGNILLDNDMEAKVCDFGISRFATDESGEASASTFCGTFGYMAPEYGMGSRVSTKGDVYSYGVVLLELLTGKGVLQGNSMNSSSQFEGLSSIVEKKIQESDAQAFDLLDPTIKSEGTSNTTSREQMILTMKVGLCCTRVIPHKRPSMDTVLEILLEINQVGQGPMPHRPLDDLIQENIVPTLGPTDTTYTSIWSNE